jgi:hypothetical protein
MRRLVLATVPVVALVVALPASAAPVSTGRIAAVRFQLPLEDGGQLRLEVSATESSAGDRIEVGVQPCEDGSCSAPVYYAGPLAPGSVQIDPTTATGRLRTTVGGVTVALDWAPVPPGTAVVSGTHGGGTDGDLAFTVTRVDPAAANVVLGDGACEGAGMVGDELRIEVPEGSAGDTVPLRRLRLPAGVPVCTG